jgi:hypothetical protein
MPQVDLATEALLAVFAVDQYSIVWVKAMVEAYNYQAAMVADGTIIPQADLVDLAHSMA